MSMKNETRREFVLRARALTAGVCCLGASALWSACSATRESAASRITYTETPDGISIPASAFASENPVILQTKKYEEPVFIAREPDGSYRALRMYCTHKGCEVKAGKDKFVCPCHGSLFSLTGEVLKGPSKDPLPSLPVSVEADLVLVRFP